MTIGEKLKKLRGNKTQKEIAMHIGVNANTLSMYENNERVPRDEIKVRIAKFFNKTVEEIFFETTAHN